MLNPACDVFRVDILRAFFYKVAYIALKVVVPLQVVDLDNDETPLESPEGPEIFYFPAAVVEG